MHTSLALLPGPLEGVWALLGPVLPPDGRKQGHTAYTSASDLSLHPRPAWVTATSSCRNAFSVAARWADLVDKTHGQTYTVIETIVKPEEKEIRKC